ncbi:MAG: UvrD-helicase domain-containing protein [Cyclobacteriaceae bacterium]|nr:UvrD-helicase domain-containing protein [Cyclobacteriaceae bacterium]
MKERILFYLNDFAKGKENNLSKEICSELNYNAEELKVRSRNVLRSILHQYSLFAISTIDAFFQKVIRSFTREAGLLGNFRLEVENELVLREVVDELMDELGTNKQLTDWVVEFSRDRLLEGENWNIVAALNGFAREIFNEEFQAIEDQLEKPTGDTNPYKETMNALRKEMAVYENVMKGKAQEALSIIDDNGITVDDFNYKDQGTALKYFMEFARGKHYPSTGSRIQSALTNGANWPAKKSRNYPELVALANNQLIPILRDMVKYDDENGPKYNSAFQVLQNFYAFGLIADITRKMKHYKQENNLMLLSDAPKFLNGVINDSDTPFIYEKVGSYFRHYLIDEFQDTSGFQWKNFKPLLKDALDQFQASMVVGDVKQSIYRWRGGDQQLLQLEVGKAMGPEATEIKELNVNYRSAEKLVQFNNILFHKASEIVSEMAGQPRAVDAYHDVDQQSQRFAGQGYVQITFLEKQEGEEDWTSESMKLLPQVIEDLQDQKVKLKDIAILVRKNEEGQRIATELLQYKNAQAKPGYRYDVVSNESLRLDTASSVKLILSALRYLHNPNDAIVRGELAYEVVRGKRLETIFTQAGKNEMEGLLPEEFVKQTAWLNKLSVFELTEELIRMFGLGGDDSELAYIQAFQDLVLEFSSLEKNDLASFLEWWENMKNKKSIQVAGNVDAINILTIHKAKGLQFKYVIIPFLNWRLNHEIAPLLWVQSDKPPFDKMGYLAVRYTSSLEKTFFEEAYKTEQSKAYIDNLNLLYVSFTRAEEGLIAFANKPRPNLQKPGTVGDLVHEGITRDTSLAAQFKDDQLVIGTLKKLNVEDEGEEYLPATLNHYASFDWRQKLVIKREGIEFFEESVSEKRAKINYGILMHRLLAHIPHKQEAEAVLNELHIQNLFTEEEKNILLPQLKAMMAHPVIGTWFDKQWEVRTEVPVLIPGGRQSRIDRVMIGRKNTVIIDYKTGEKKQQDRTQVESYTGLLSQMGYPNVEGYLLYLDEMEVVTVVKGSTLSLEF